MKTKAILSCLLALALSSAFILAGPLGTVFTYQGRLASGTNAATGLYDFSFALYDAASSGGQWGATLVTNAVPITNGYFTATLDFGSVFDGGARWLDIAVRTNGADAFTPLAPRQPLTPVPYAITASNVAGGVAAGQLTGTIALAQLPAAVVTNNATGVTLTGTIKALGGLVIENRTSDPPSPAPGQIWLRTDL